MYVAGPCNSICDKSTCAPGDHHNFVIVYEEQEGIVTGNKRRIHWRGKEIDKGNNISPWECKKLSYYTYVLQEGTKIQWRFLFSLCHNSEGQPFSLLMTESPFTLCRPCSLENAGKALDSANVLLFPITVQRFENALLRDLISGCVLSGVKIFRFISLTTHTYLYAYIHIHKS